MIQTIAIILASLIFWGEDQSPQNPPEQLLYISNHLEEAVIVSVAQVWLDVPGRTTSTVRLRDLFEPNEDVASIEIATHALKPHLAGRLLVRLPRTGHAEVYVGGYRPPTEYERGRATPAERRNRTDRWDELFKDLRDTDEQDEASAPRFIVATSHPVLETKRNSIGMKLIRVPAGQFMMGCPPTEPGCNATERQHLVVLTKDFWLGETEVTQEQWQRVMKTSPSAVKDAKLPVHSVTWFEAKEFCERLSAMEGKRYRLPTEAEWEYACRAGTTTTFSFGDSAARLSRYGWYNGNARGRPQPVAGKLPNPWGFYDMHGNVAEWCEDWFAWRYPLEKQIDPTGPNATGTGPLGSVGRVVRGGRHDFYAEICRSAARDDKPPNARYVSVGFRVVLETAESP